MSYFVLIRSIPFIVYCWGGGGRSVLVRCAGNEPPSSAAGRTLMYHKYPHYDTCIASRYVEKNPGDEKEGRHFRKPSQLQANVSAPDQKDAFGWHDIFTYKVVSRHSRPSIHKKLNRHKARVEFPRAIKYILIVTFFLF